MMLLVEATDQWTHLCRAVESGEIFLYGSSAIPRGACLYLKLIFASEQSPLVIRGTVSSSYPHERDKAMIALEISGDSKSALSDIVKKGVPPKRPAAVQAQAPKSFSKSGRPDRRPFQFPAGQGSDHAQQVYGKSETSGRALSFEEMKSLVMSQEYEVDLKSDKATASQVIAEKKELTPQEREMAEPVAKFIMNLTKAMSRSGYYDPDHPSAKSAKKGLYEEFLRVTGNFNEIAFTCQKTPEGVEIFITGILDRQVNVRSLVGSGMADLFVPKLIEYCDRKQLMSFAIKKDISQEHFHQFIDIMSDPNVDRDDIGSKGAYLTRALIENNITEISTVFYTDVIDFEMDLPWRVQVAMQRLAKDLNVLPLFKGVSAEAIRRMKIQTVKDIIRPLNHPKYFNEFLVNCYIIADKISGMTAEEIEKIIVDAFPLDLLLPTCRYTFEELERLETLKAHQPDNPSIPRRLTGIQRILKTIAGRVVIEKAPGAIIFLEQLYRNHILAFKELPVEAQYLVNTRNMTRDITANFINYSNNFLKATSVDDALVYIKCFRRVLPMLADEKNWLTVRDIAILLNQTGARDILSKVILSLPQEMQPLLENPSEDRFPNHHQKLICHVFGGISRELISAYETADKKEHLLLEEILDALGAFGVDVLSQVLVNSKNKETRKMCVASLVHKGELSRNWAIDILQRPDAAWYVYRNALMILRDVSACPDDFDRIRVHLAHENPRIREEMISLIIAMKPRDAESLIISAMDDPDPKVRWRAGRALADISPISQSAVNHLLSLITKTISEDKAEADDRMKRLMNLISAITGLREIPNKTQVESDIIRGLKSMIGQEKGLRRLFKRVTSSENEITLIKSALPLLGRIGGPESMGFLKKLSKSHSRLLEPIQKAIQQIESRTA